MKTIHTHYAIARAARADLGRPASRSRASRDWTAVDVVALAAYRAGLTEPLLQWVPGPGASLRGLARAYCTRYAQAYGPGPWGHDAAGAARSVLAVLAHR